METLTLEQAYYIGEMIGTFILIISLIFVGLHIHQNTRTMRYEVRNKTRERFLNFQLILAQQDDLADIYFRGTSTFEILNELEQKRFFMICAYTLNAMSESFSSFQDGMLSSNYWDSMKIGIRNELQSDGVRKYWEDKKHLYAGPFQMFIDDLMQDDSTA
jgi:hypothetical protein